ncbi:MAG: phage tail fiber protein [Candidatus Competibacteraceae bacterium]
MSNATDFLETAVGNALFLGQPLSVTELTVHLYSTAPNDAGLNGVEIPAGANGYQPVPFNPGADHWIKGATQDTNGNTVFRNNSAVQFPTSISAWPTIVAFGLKSQTGQLLFVAALTTSKTVAIGDAPVFLAGELEIAIG